MKIAILSDIHDHLANLHRALDIIQTEAADVLICCGDICSSFVLREMAERFSGPIHVMLGNNDGDLFKLTTVANDHTHVTIYNELMELELDGKRITGHHYPKIARLIAAAGQHDVVCYGHTHRYEVTRHEQVLLINPGDIMGRKTGSATFAIYDTQTDDVVRFEVSGCMEEIPFK